MPRKLSEQDLGFTKHSRDSHCYNVSETLAKEAWELEAHSGGKKRYQFGKSSTPTYYMSTTSPAPCFSRSYPSQPDLSWARTSKEEWSPTIHPRLCLCLHTVASEANPRRPYKDQGRLKRRGANIRPTSQK